MDCWDAIAIISVICCPACLFVCLFELGNYTISFLRALLPILAIYKMGKVAATVPAMSEANMLCVIHS